MGKWAEVHCNCANRIPLPGGDSSFACGHRGGIFLEFWPGEIIHLARVIADIFGRAPFEVFENIGNTMSYDNDWELLLVTPEDVPAWLMEIEQLRRAAAGGGELPHDEVQEMLAALREPLTETLDDAERLCRAALETGNPIRLTW